MRPSAPGKKVLVVDDEPDERIFLCRLLELGGYESMLASDATEGLDMAVRERPDLILLAVMFDHHGNLLLFDDLKLDTTLKQIPVVLLSSIDKKTLFQLRALPGAPRGGFLLRPEGFLGKPPEADELLGLLNTLTQSRPPDFPAGP
jgi:CheY-like chemotaxis protein